MKEDPITLTTSWKGYQEHITRAIAPLTAEQLALRAALHLRSIGELALHIVACRAYWFTDFLGEDRWGLKRQIYLDPLVPHQTETGTPMLSAAPIPRSRSGADPTAKGCKSTLTQAPALWWRSHFIGTAHAVHRDDSCECWLHTPAAGSHQPLAAAPGV